MIKRWLNDIIFDWPWMLLLLIPLAAYAFASLRQILKTAQPVKVSSLASAENFSSWKTRLAKGPRLLVYCAMGCLVVALAKPAKYKTIEQSEGQGIDIMLCIDVSGSMLARDFKPDRLRAALEVARRFVSLRKGDRMGLIIFSRQSLALCPLTTDQQALLQQLQRVEYGELADGTAIGTGLASAVGRMRHVSTPSKVVILLTDGEDTGGFYDPETARQLAITYGVKVYTISIGSTGMAPMPYQTAMGTELRQERVNIDEKLLTHLAVTTGGKYFRAASGAALDSVYSAIDRLEKSDVKTTLFTQRTDRFFPWVGAAILLLLAATVLEKNVLRMLS
jgi:Ca-activated chloride channel family protein